MPTDVLALSWAVQIALASGYAAYIIAYRGIRSHHSAQDTAFSVLVFSLITSGVLWLMREQSPVFGSMVAFTLSIAAAALWRSLGGPVLTWILRKLKVTWADDTPSAWARLQENRSIRVSQIAVWLNDGSRLICEDASLFAGLPYAPYVLGTNGDVLLYVTHVRPARAVGEGGKMALTPQTTTLDATRGVRVTYVPSTQIARVTIRHEAKLNPRQLEVAAQPVASSAE